MVTFGVRLKNALRWIALVPTALLGASIAFIVFRVANMWTMRQAGDMSYSLGALLLDAAAGAAFGAVYAWLAFCLAPHHKVESVFSLLGVLILLGGVMIGFVLMVSHEYAALVPPVVAVWTVIRAGIELYREYGLEF